MLSISDIISGQVKSATNKINIPGDVKNQVLGGLSDSILGSLTQTATQAGGIDELKALFTGKTDAAKSSVTALAGDLFKGNVLDKLNLGSAGPALSALIPTIMSKVSHLIKDQDGDGDVDLNDILLTLKGGSGGLLGTVGGLLGGLFGKK